MKISFTILGQPYSKANSRKQVTIGAKTRTIEGVRQRVGGRTAFIKSDEARAYEENALKQVPPAARVRLEGHVRMTLRIFYKTELPDLDESLILDILQDRYVRSKVTKERILVQKGVYRNDRQVRERHVYWGKDPVNPRAEIEVEPLVAQQESMFAEAVT